MANIYDLANIKAGDPGGRVGENLSEAIANLGQFRMSKKIWEEIQDALKESASRSKEGGLLGSLSGSIVGGLLKKYFDVTNPLLGALISGGTSGIFEKTRQDQSRATAPLKRILSKYKGRSEVEGLDDTIKGIQAAQKGQIASDAITSGVTSFLFPTEGGDPITPADGVDVTGTTPKYTGINKNILNKITGGYLGGDTGAEIMKDDFIKSDKGQLILGLLKNIGPTAWKEAFGADIKPFYQSQKPQFRNPYRGGY
jgi:hypothetical protein